MCFSTVENWELSCRAQTVRSGKENCPRELLRDFENTYTQYASSASSILNNTKKPKEKHHLYIFIYTYILFTHFCCLLTSNDICINTLCNGGTKQMSDPARKARRVVLSMRFCPLCVCVYIYALMSIFGSGQSHGNWLLHMNPYLNTHTQSQRAYMKKFKQWILVFG